MKEKNSALHSKYIIDGVSRRLTPAEMLDDCLASKVTGKSPEKELFEPIVDESTDPSPSISTPPDQDPLGCLKAVMSILEEPRAFPAAFADSYTKSRIAKSLLDAVWMNGHFKL